MTNLAAVPLSAAITVLGLPTVLLLVLLPSFIGIVTGFAAGKRLQRTKTPGSTLAVMLAMLLVSAGIGFAVNLSLIHI